MANFALYSPCMLCPRRCGADRGGGKAGYCGETAELRIACASLHYGEEPSLTGSGGSGTIFVSGCNLRCVFCQNYQISAAAGGNAAVGNSSAVKNTLGRGVDTAEFARICLALQDRGAENINIVTGSHAVPALAAGLRAAKGGNGPAGAGLRIPVLWNSSAYELPETLEFLADLVDIYLPDLKTTDGALGARYFNAPDYPETACGAIKKMLEMGSVKERSSGGAPPLIVRHLVLPDHLDSTRGVLGWFAENIQNRGNPAPLLSLMFQYTPVREAKNPAGGRTGGSAATERCVGREEYRTVLDWLAEFGIEDGFCQDLVPGGALPDFERANPFPSELAVPVWHWRRGFL